MKKPMFIAAGLLIWSAACAQDLKEAEVPAAVKESFRKAHPVVKDLRWEKEGANFEAEFKAGKMEQSIVYDPSGQLIETEIEIKAEELPAAAKDYLSKNHNHEKVREASKITDAKGVVSYEAEVKDKDLIFDSNGKFNREQADEAGEKDK